jgi:exodeoxyribonuclease VII large subunit
VSIQEPFPGKKIYRVSEITGLIRDMLESGFTEVWVQGEISNLRRPGSGHFYFTLKDEQAMLHAVMFRFQNIYLRFRPEHGMEVVCRGRISVYDQRGEYQLIVDQMDPVGIGALQVRFEQLKAKLEKDGLFNPDRKKALPEYPGRIAIITSPTSAAIRDMLRIIRSKQAPIEILIIPSRVQGEGAAEELAKALDLANKPNLARPKDKKPLELIILARGGGSLEDLWAFNEEVLARAIFHSALPVLSAVGHEIDFTIADFVADLRAPTPTAAAEHITAAKQDMQNMVQDLQERLLRTILKEQEQAAERLNWFARSLPDPRRELEKEMLRLDDQLWKMEKALRDRLIPRESSLQHLERTLSLAHPLVYYKEAIMQIAKIDGALERAMSDHLEREMKKFESRTGRLNALSPLATLSRGYSIARGRDSKEIIRDAKKVNLGDWLELILHRGKLECEVRGKSEGPAGTKPGGTA